MRAAHACGPLFSIQARRRIVAEINLSSKRNLRARPVTGLAVVAARISFQTKQLAGLYYGISRRLVSAKRTHGSKTKERKKKLGNKLPDPRQRVPIGSIFSFVDSKHPCRGPRRGIDKSNFFFTTRGRGPDIQCPVLEAGKQQIGSEGETSKALAVFCNTPKKTSSASGY